MSVILSAPEGTDRRHDEHGPGEHPQPRRRLRRRGARHRAVGHHDRDPDPRAVRQHGRGAHGRPAVHRRRQGRHVRLLGGRADPDHRPEGVRRGVAGGQGVCGRGRRPSSPASRPRRRPTPRRRGSRRSPRPPPSASASASASASVSASPIADAEGPGSTAGEYCLTDFVGAELQCYPDYKTAQAAYKSLDTKVTETTWCITAPQPKTPDASRDTDPQRLAEEVRVALALGVRRAPRTIRARPTPSSIRPAPRRCRATPRRSRRPNRPSRRSRSSTSPRAIAW